MKPMIGVRSSVVALAFLPVWFTATEKSRRGAGLLMVGALIATVPLLDLPEEPSIAGADERAFLIGGYAIGLVGAFIARSGWRDLSRSIWWYNSQFAED